MVGGPPIEGQLWRCFGDERRHRWTRSVVAKAGWSEFGVATGPEGRATHAVSATQRSTTSRVQRLSYNLGPPPFSGGDSLPQLRRFARGNTSPFRRGARLELPAEYLGRDRLLLTTSGAESGAVLIGEGVTLVPEVDGGVQRPIWVDQMRTGKQTQVGAP